MVGGNKNPDRIKNGLHIYTAGTSLQEMVILIFVGLSINFSRRLKRASAGQDTTSAKKLMFVLYFALGLITVSPHLSLLILALTNRPVSNPLQNSRVRVTE